MKKITTEKIPMWALCYIFYGDPNGLTDNDIKDIDDFEKSLGTKGAPIFDVINDEPYFTNYPAFGLATDVVDCDIYQP